MKRPDREGNLSHQKLRSIRIDPFHAEAGELRAGTPRSENISVFPLDVGGLPVIPKTGRTPASPPDESCPSLPNRTPLAGDIAVSSASGQSVSAYCLTIYAVR